MQNTHGYHGYIWIFSHILRRRFKSLKSYQQMGSCNSSHAVQASNPVNVADQAAGETEKDKQELQPAADVKCGPHLESSESLTGFPVFPDGNKSLLARFNTREMWEQLCDKKDKYGVSYKLCILSGCKNIDSSVGVYAGSHDSYTAFAPIMDKVIEEYHGHKPEDKHVSDMDASKLQCPPFPEDEAAMIVSTRIRVGRNLEGYPLAPGITKEQREEVMKKVVSACETFTDDLAGTFYPLEGMEKETQNQLIADHFLFK